MHEITISPLKLLVADYKSSQRSEGICWQKRVTDERGTKYFINIIQSNPVSVEDTKSHDSCFWWPSIQFKIPVGDGFQTIHVELVQWLNNSGQHTGLTIEAVEQQLDAIWTKLSGQYYELKSEE